MYFLARFGQRTKAARAHVHCAAGPARGPLVAGPRTASFELTVPTRRQTGTGGATVDGGGVLVKCSSRVYLQCPLSLFPSRCFTEDILDTMESDAAAVAGAQANGGSSVECDTSAAAATCSGGIDLRSIINPCESLHGVSTVHYLSTLVFGSFLVPSPPLLESKPFLTHKPRMFDSSRLREAAELTCDG